tara:strand:- start:41 stop:271 length:231 start_codon:yes stop_codon:yes gene_type:complete
MDNKIFIDYVKLVETPTDDNGHFYVVEADTYVNGSEVHYYVSALFGKEAKGLVTGTKLALYRSSSKEMSAYTLVRV